MCSETTRKWYNSEDDISRLLVLDDGQTTTDSTRATFSGYGHTSFGHQPQLVVFYRNTVGVEGYYDYHTQNIGRAGTASVNNFTLGLSLSVPVFSAPSQALPFGLALTYNSPLSDASFTDSGSLHTKNYTTSGTGYGWKTSVQQSVAEVQLTGKTGSNKKWLVYTDGDGTEHYFSKDPDSSTKYEDEDGLGLTITITNASNPTEYTMEDKETNTWVFLNGYLLSYTDHNGNALYYEYNGNDYISNAEDWKPRYANTTYRVTSVWRQNNGAESATELVTLDYMYENADDNRLRTVTDRANRSTTFDYNSSGELTTITYPDGKTATYTYSSAAIPNPQTNSTKTFHRLVKARDNEAQYEIRYSYRSESSLRVKEIQEYTGAVGSELAGTIMRGYKSSATTTFFRYCGADNALQTEDDLVVHYYFDNWGRPINVATFDTDDSGEDIQNILGVSAGAYTQNKETNKDNNRLTNAASAGLQSVNLLNNTGLESATNLAGWTAAGDGAAATVTTSNTASTVEVTPRTGSKMMKLFLNDSSGKESCYQTVFLTGEKTYVFSAYVNTAAVSLLGTGGAYLSFRVEDEPGEWNDVASSRTLNYRTSTAVDSGWERLEAVFTPEDSGIYQVAVNLSDMGKVVLADDLQLETVSNTGGIEREASASTVNLLQLGGFELPGANDPDTSQVQNWWDFSYKVINNQRVYRITLENDDDRGTVIRLSNAPNRQVWATQEVQLNAPSNRTYLLSGWGKIPVGYTSSGNDLKYNNATYERFFGFIVEIHYAGISEIEYQYVAFNDNLGDWQYTTGVIAPKRANKTVEKLVVKIRGDLLPNDAWVDDVSLIQEPVQTYTYDEKGNLTASTNSEGKTSTELDSKDRLKKYTAMNGVEYNLYYANNSTRNPDYMTTDNVKTSYEYDSSGGVEKTTVKNTAGGKKLVSETAYDNDKNFAVSSTDANGSTVQSQYYLTRGLLEISWDPKETATNYHYNYNNDRPTSSFISGMVSLSYLYDQRGRLEQLTRGAYNGSTTFQQAYHFDYDVWGNTESIQVWNPNSGNAPTAANSTELAKYFYNTNGTLSQMNYPNGDHVLYFYDLLDRLIEEVYYDSSNNVKADYRYVYNANGQLAKQYAVETNSGVETVTESYVFEYDSLGRLIRSREEGGSDTIQRTEHLYDNANRLTAQNWSIGTKGYSESYSYRTNDGALENITLATGDTVNYHYDDLKRADVVTTKNSNNDLLLTRNLSYLDFDNDSTRTTSRLGEYTVKGASNNVIVQNQFKYDANGNITKIKEAYPVNNTVAFRDLAVYVYDSLNQLEYETRYTYTDATDTPAATTEIHYTIDTAGNIRSVTTTDNDGTTTVAYTYGNTTWADLLTAYDGHAIAYEGQTYNALTGMVTGTVASGNPINWYNGNSYTDLTWTQGRRLESITKGSDTYSYEYDMSGIRSVKNVDGLRHEYVTQNGRVVRELITNEATGAFVRCLDFFYDENGKPFAMRKYRDSSITSYDTFHYVTNAQGDVVQLNFQGGTVYAEYTYDAWGNILTKTGSLADVNPLRYRGYYFDSETGFYYLQSRYYDPTLGRFINADSYASTGQGFLGYNMFAYCGNNPTNKNDASGHRPMIIGDDNENEIPDYLEVRWFRQTIRAKKMLEKKKVSFPVKNRQDGVAVDCNVPFAEFEETDSNGNKYNLLDNPLFFYAVCQEIEYEVRIEEKKCIDKGQNIAGSMSFIDIYQELKYHYDGYKTLPEWSSFYENCKEAYLNYDEDRLFCWPRKLISVPEIPAPKYWGD